MVAWRSVDFPLLVISIFFCFSPGAAAREAKITRDRADYLERFLLVNSEGEAAPPPGMAVGKCPFGMVIELEKRVVDDPYTPPPKGTGTHFGRYVITNAHVVPDRKHLEKYFVVYFDKTGVKKSSPIMGILFHDLNKYVAVLELPESTVEDWASAEAVAENGSLPSDQPVYSVSVDPLDLRDDVKAKIGGGRRPGAVLQKKTGRLSSRAPEVTIDGRELGREIRKRVKFSPLYLTADPRNGENLDIVVGNSGSLYFSETAQGQVPVGVLSMGLMQHTDQEIEAGVRPVRMSPRSASHYGVVSPIGPVLPFIHSSPSCVQAIAQQAA